MGNAQFYTSPEPGEGLAPLPTSEPTGSQSLATRLDSPLPDSPESPEPVQPAIIHDSPDSPEPDQVPLKPVELSQEEDQEKAVHKLPIKKKKNQSMSRTSLPAFSEQSVEKVQSAGVKALEHFLGRNMEDRGGMSRIETGGK